MRARNVRSSGVAFLIRSLNVGGAERQLVEIARGLHLRGTAVTVLTFYSDGPLSSELRAVGVSTIGLHKKGRWDLVFLFRLVHVLRRIRPAVLYCFLPTANVLGVLVRWFANLPRVFWGIRTSSMDVKGYGWFVRLEARVARILARGADAIVCNSYAGRVDWVRQGVSEEKLFVVPNGINVDHFAYDEQARARLRERWGVRNDDVLIGLVGRLDPVKDHQTFLRAASKVAGTDPRAQFVCVGSGMSDYASDMRSLGQQLGLETRLRWVDETSDARAIYSALDVLCSSSVAEGFSNVVAEAMACERVCVVTDVGDARWIVGEAGRVVPARAPLELAQSCREVLAMSLSERSSLGRLARARVVDKFSVVRLIDATEQLLRLG